MNVLVVNSGSSSLKFQVISTDLERIREHKDDRLCRGEVEGIGAEAIIRFQQCAGAPETMTASLRDITAAVMRDETRLASSIWNSISHTDPVTELFRKDVCAVLPGE